MGLVGSHRILATDLKVSKETIHFLDDVRMLPIPNVDESYFSGGNLTVHASNGQIGGSYSILASTNVALPLTNWMPMATTLLGTSEPFFLTARNAIKPNLPQRVFILRLQ